LKILAFGVAALLAGYIAICWLLYAQQDRLLYPGAADSDPPGFSASRIPSGSAVLKVWELHTRRTPLLRKDEWTFAGNVVIHRDGRGYRRVENVRLRFSREGVWLEPTGGAPLHERPPPLLERLPPG
jgi:hypothetical protein